MVLKPSAEHVGAVTLTTGATVAISCDALLKGVEAVETQIPLLAVTV